MLEDKKGREVMWLVSSPETSVKSAALPPPLSFRLLPA